MWCGPRLGYYAGLAAAVGAMMAQPALAARDAPECADRKDVLGVSRILEVDTSGGLRFGRMQYKDFTFLKPGEVVLTFDDGPLRKYSTKVLNALEAECTKATFFMVGRMAVTDPEMVREIARRGHTIGVHTWSHKNLARISRASRQREVELGFSAVSAALGKPVAPFFRFPYLGDSKTAISELKKRNLGIFSIDVDSRDFRTGSGSVMAGRILSGLKRNGKGILLFHDIQRSTANGIKGLLQKLKRAGYKVVHLVAKQPVTTRPEYDAIALKEMNRRKKSWSTRPNPAKYINWPVSSTGFPARQPLTFIEEPVARIKTDAAEAPPPQGAAGDADENRIQPEEAEREQARTPRSARGSVSKYKRRPRYREHTVTDVLQGKIYSYSD